MGLIISIINIASNNIINLLYFYIINLIFAYPLGLLAKKKAGIILDKFNFLFCIGCGLSLLVLLFYFSILIRMPFSLFVVIILVFNMCIIIKNKRDFTFKLLSFNKYCLFIYSIFLILFLYYLIPPLLIDYGFTRDYDVFALGIKQTGEFALPFYNIENYYPLLASTLTVFFSNLISSININKLMLFIFPLITFLIYVLFYLIGIINFNNKYLGLSILISATLVGTLKNAVIGGSTYSFLLATHFFLLFIIFFFKYLDSKNTWQLIFSGLFSAGILLSHADIFIVFLWFCLALFISRIILFNKKKTVISFLLVVFISVVIASPYLHYALSNSRNVSGFWTEQMWNNKINGESSAKDINYVVHFVGKISLLLGIIGLLILYVVQIEKWLKITLFLTTLLLYFQNHQFIHYLVKPILHIYPLNIIMWTGLTIPVVLLSSLMIYYFSTKVNKYKNQYFFGFFLLFLILLVDYETVNVQNIYRPGSGFLIAGLSNRNNVVNSGDLEAMNFLKQNNFSGRIINMDNFAGYLTPVYTEKQSQLLFYEESYHDLRKWGFMDELTNESLILFNQPLSNNTDYIIEKNNLSLIYLPSTASINSNKYFNYSPLIFDKFSIIYRQDGAKILNIKKTDNGKIIHLEAEDFIDNKDLVQDYVYGKTIGIKSIKLPLDQEINFKVNYSYFNNNMSTIYIKHLTFWEPLKIRIRIGNFTKEISKVSDKLQFSETMIEIPAEFLDKPIQIQSLSDEVNFIGKRIVPEIDWIEVEN